MQNRGTLSRLADVDQFPDKDMADKQCYHEQCEVRKIDNQYEKTSSNHKMCVLIAWTSAACRGSPRIICQKNKSRIGLGEYMNWLESNFLSFISTITCLGLLLSEAPE